jgi:hypothetical protein
MRRPPEMGVCWPKQARHTSQMDQLRMRGEELPVAAPARPSEVRVSVGVLGIAMWVVPNMLSIGLARFRS